MTKDHNSLSNVIRFPSRAPLSDADLEFQERISRIKKSLNRITKLLADLKRMSES